jgi:flagellar motility protein MotE (MotC chaperone)/sporulation protein YlmC with PRC-barrel domain
MPSLTELLDKPIRDPSGDEVAHLGDLVVRIVALDESQPAQTVDLYPPVTGVVARLKGPRGSRDVYIPWDKVGMMDSSGVKLNSPALNLRRFAKRDDEIVLRGGLFDRQVVDVEGRRVVRINDLDLAERNGVWRLVAVDVSPSAAVRRLPFGQKMAARMGRHAPLIDWAMVVPVTASGIAQDGANGRAAVRLRVPRDRLAIMRPADIANLLEQLTPQQSADLLEDMDDAHAADTLEELEDEQQAQILRAMDKERAADVLEEMEPDEAADALQGVSSEEAADLLARMDREEAQEVQELLGYPEDSAGGIMTTEYISVPEWASVGDVVTALRERTKAAAGDLDDPVPEALPEIYIVAEDRPPLRPGVRRNGARPRGARISRPRAPVPHGPLDLETEGRLVGVVTLRDLVLALPETPVTDIMRKAESVARALDNELDVARIVADEDLVALPVVDDDGKMLGIVSVDDAIDVILPTAWKKRIPRRYR